MRILIMALLMIPLAIGCGGDGDEKASADADADADTDADADADPVEEVLASDFDVSFPGADEDLTLEGRLYVPQHMSNEPVPGIVFTHGSGPQGRFVTSSGQLGMSFGFEFNVFEELAIALQNEGYTVLLYDKRTCTTMNGCENEYPAPAADTNVTDFLLDSEAAVQWLGSHASVDANNLILVGHSQGASYVPILASERTDIRAGVMLAGGFNPIDLVFIEQVQTLLERLVAAGYNRTDMEEALAAELEASSQLQSLRAGTFAGPNILGAPTDFWLNWMSVDEQAVSVMDDVNVPLLALSGDYDWNVLPTQTEQWGELFNEYPSVGHQSEILPCVSHALNCIDGSGLNITGVGDHVAETVIQTMVDFLEESLN